MRYILPMHIIPPPTVPPPPPPPPKATLAVADIGNLAGDIVHETAPFDEIADAYSLTPAQLRYELEHNQHLINTVASLKQAVKDGTGDDGLVYRIKAVVNQALPVVAGNMIDEDQDPSVTARTTKSLLDYLTMKERNQIVAAKDNQIAGGGVVNVSFNVSPDIRGISDNTGFNATVGTSQPQGYIEGDINQEND